MCLIYYCIHYTKLLYVPHFESFMIISILYTVWISERENYAKKQRSIVWHCRPVH